MRTCQTPNCERVVAGVGHGYCSDCLPILLRTGQLPVIRRRPEWLRRAAERPHGLARDLTGALVA